MPTLQCVIKFVFVIGVTAVVALLLSTEWKSSLTPVAHHLHGGHLLQDDIVRKSAEVLMTSSPSRTITSTRKFMEENHLLEIYDRVPKSFLPKYRSRCWQESDGIKCLPYFYQIGSYKSGTSDVWDKLVQHPDVFPVLKEPHWWAWRRYGYTGLPCHGNMVLKIRSLTGGTDDSSFDWYLRWFHYQLNGTLGQNQVFGDASITTLWGTSDGRSNYTEPEPTHVLADVIHSVQPDAKIYVVLRDPLARALSEYFYAHKREEISQKDFHEEVERSLEETRRCLEHHRSAKACAFSLEIGNWRKFVPLHGAYCIYLKEWIEAFGKDKVHVMRTEDWKENPKQVLNELISFLELDPLSEGNMSSILKRRVQNKNQERPFVAMLNSTRRLLEEFYRPWNRRLVDLLGDSKFLWEI